MNIETNENFITIDKNEICEKDDETPQIYKLIKNKLTFINLKKDILYDLNLEKKIDIFKVTNESEYTDIPEEELPENKSDFMHYEILMKILKIKKKTLL